MARRLLASGTDDAIADSSGLYDMPLEEVVVPLGSGEHRRSLRLATAAGPSD